MQALARCGLRAICATKPALLLKPFQNNVVRNAAALYTSCTYIGILYAGSSRDLGQQLASDLDICSNFAVELCILNYT